jgi:hypothetical protein
MAHSLLVLAIIVSLNAAPRGAMEFNGAPGLVGGLNLKVTRHPADDAFC